MKGATGAVLVVIAGAACLALVAVSAHRRVLAAAAAAPAAGPARPTGIDWAAARQQARLDAGGGSSALYARLVAATHSKMSRLAIPVLLPGDEELTSDLELFPNGGFYSASSSSRGMTVLVTGSGAAFPVSQRAARAASGGVPPTAAEPDRIAITRSESGLDATFARFGASYSVSLDCRRPDDRRCAEGGWVRGMISRMLVLIPQSPG